MGVILLRKVAAGGGDLSGPAGHLPFPREAKKRHRKRTGMESCPSFLCEISCESFAISGRCWGMTLPSSQAPQQLPRNRQQPLRRRCRCPAGGSWWCKHLAVIGLAIAPVGRSRRPARRPRPDRSRRSRSQQGLVLFVIIVRIVDGQDRAGGGGDIRIADEVEDEGILIRKVGGIGAVVPLGGQLRIELSTLESPSKVSMAMSSFSSYQTISLSSFLVGFRVTPPVPAA